MPTGIAFGARTTRDTNYAGGMVRRTANEVGPGAYAIPPSIGATQKPGYAGFGSLAERKFESRGQGTSGRVGPGAYDIQEAPPAQAPRTKTYQSPFRSSGKKPLRTTKHQTPGPGAYIGNSMWDGPDRVALRKQEEAAVRAARQNVNWVRVPTAPSIPGAAQCYGYEEGDSGALVMQVPVNKGFSGVVGDTVGPHDYEPDVGPVKPRAARRIDIGRQAGRPLGRTISTGGLRRDVNPLEEELRRSGANLPPAPEEPLSPPSFRALSPPKPSASFVPSKTKSRLPKNDNPGPGPGTYMLPGALKIERKPESQQFFGSTSDRFEQSQRHTFLPGPGPGAYVPPSQFDNRQRVRQSDPSFRSGSSRFHQLNKAATRDVGPGSYECSGIASSIQKKISSRPVGAGGVFGSTSKRFTTFDAPSSQDGPGPADYVKNRPEPDRVDHPSATAKGKVLGRDVQKPQASFTSETTRFVEKSAGSDAPPPGTYDTTGPEKKVKGLVQMREGGGNTRQFYKPTATGELVGPGTYNTEPSIKKQKGNNRPNVMVTTASRFPKAPPSKSPGPGAYDTELTYGNMLKQTYNIAIAEGSSDWR